MKTNREVVNLFRKDTKELHGDTYLTDRAILRDLYAIRNLLIKREIDKRRLKDTDSIYTTIPCLEMISVPLAECCSYTSPCTIRRSKYPLPKIGESIYGYIMDGVWNITQDMSFDRGSATSFANMLDLTDKRPNMFWVQNNYLYVTDKDIELLSARVFIEDIEIDPKLFKCSEEHEDIMCSNPLDREFKAPGYLISSIIEMATQKYIRVTRGLPTDTTDNDTQTPN